VLAAAAVVVVRAQERFEFFIFAVDKDGVPVLDVKDTEVSMKEEAGQAQVLGVRRYGWPLKVTILLDNGPKINSAMSSVRASLEKFFKAIPPDVSVSLITTAPSPRFLVRDSKDQVQIQKAVTLITPEPEDGGAYGRFADSLIEYSHRLEDEFRQVKPEQKPPYLPVLIAISTTAQDGSLVRKEDNIQMIKALIKYRVWTNFVMLTPSRAPSFGDAQGTDDLIDSAQIGELAKVVQESTGGRYIPMAGSAVSGLTTKVMPDLAKDIVIRYLKQMTQHQVVVERAAGATGPIKNLEVGVNRAGVSVMGLSLDGNMP
jgi:hypothetical protein